jgi:antitoxin ParD1/3/4
VLSHAKREQKEIAMTDIHLSEQDRTFIDEQVQAGIHKDTDAVIAAGLRLLGSKEGKLMELQRLIQEGVDDVEAGRVIEFERAEDITAHVLKMAEEHKNASTSADSVAKGAKRSTGYS